mgnify:CR=1 FL=1
MDASLFVSIRRHLSLPLLSWVALTMRSCLSQRGLICFVCLAAAFLATRAPWIRPPLSADLRGWEIPLSITDYEDATAVIDGVRSIHLASPGVVLLVVLVPATILALHDPRHAGLLGGLLLVTTCATHAMVAARQPVLFELLEQQQDQRQDMITVLHRMSSGQSLASDDNGRVSSQPVSLVHLGRISSVARFALYGIWLVPLSVALILCVSAGGLTRRLAKLGGWTAVAIAITIPVCSQRMRAEWHWEQAWQLTHQADYRNAREQLAQAIECFPALADLQRTWYLAGKLDFHDRRESVQLLFYRAFQLWQQNAVNEAADLLVPQMRRPDSPAAVGTLAAEIRTQLGVTRFLDAAGQVVGDQRSMARSSAAAAAWKSALQVDPRRADCLLYLTLSYAWSGRDRDLVDQTTGQLLERIADRTVRADLLNCLGDVFFRAGNFAAARRAYNDSREQFDLPKDMNFRARRGLLGT